MNWFSKETQSLYIARPQAADAALVWKHPDQNIPRNAQLVVRSDERAVFFRQGAVAGVLEAGNYRLDSANIPFLGRLISPFTGANHYVTELFFVRMAETRRDCAGSDLGTYRDRASQHMVRVTFSAAFSFRISDPIAFITQLGGQGASSESFGLEIVDGRVRSALRTVVSRSVQSQPVLDVVSNSHSEEFGQQVREMIAPEFRNQGIEFARFLELHLDLDESSSAILQEYQSRVADLTIQAQGAQIAQDPGFTTFNLVQGQKNAMDGLGAGLSKGASGPIFGLGFGMPGMIGAPGAIGPGAQPRRVAATGPASPGISQPPRYFMVGERGPEGPFDAKRIVLLILSSGKSPSSIRIRPEGEPAEVSICALDEPAIRTELDRRTSRPTTDAKRSDVAVFESVLEAAARDKVISPDEIAMLVPLARAAGLATTEAEARGVIESRARAIGCTIEVKPAPEPGRSALFSHSCDGGPPESGLSADAVVSKVKARPGSKHWVWAEGFDGWRPVESIPEIRVLLGAAPPPPPPPPAG